MDLQRIILILLLLTVVGGGYYYFQIYNAESLPEGRNQAVIDLDVRLNEIRPIASVEIDTSLFENTFFRSLKTVVATSTPVLTPGRKNPFAPF